MESENPPQNQEYCFTVLPESTNMVPMKVYEADDSSEEGMRWR